jgi:hypothetical protein
MKTVGFAEIPQGVEGLCPESREASFVVSLSNHERSLRSPFDRLRASGFLGKAGWDGAEPPAGVLGPALSAVEGGVPLTFFELPLSHHAGRGLS